MKIPQTSMPATLLYQLFIYYSSTTTAISAFVYKNQWKQVYEKIIGHWRTIHATLRHRFEHCRKASET